MPILTFAVFARRHRICDWSVLKNRAAFANKCIYGVFVFSQKVNGSDSYHIRGGKIDTYVSKNSRKTTNRLQLTVLLNAKQVEIFNKFLNYV